MADPYIEIDAVSLSPSEAERALVELLNAYGTKMTPEVRAGTHRIILTLGSGGTSTLAAPELLTQLHLSGACELDRARWVDTDPYGSIATEVPEGLPIVIATGPRNSPPLHGPGYATNDVVTELLDDILIYRSTVAQSSHTGEMYRPAFRAYRAYLSASISAIDASLNRLSWFALNEPASQLSTPDKKLLLRKTSPLDDKLRKWLPILTKGGTVREDSIEWCQYQQLKSARNAVIHVNEPEFIFAPRDAADVLNLCRHGVGGLLREISRLLHRHPAPAILRVARAPLARFVAHV